MAYSGTISQTVFNTGRVIDNAFRRCKLPAEQISGEYIEIANDCLYLMLSDLANQGVPLWTIEKIILPLYNGVEALSLGVPVGAKFEPIAPRTAKPIVFYGTSITHGASASRPGMVHTAILGRRLDLPVINLGFSGNGRMDAAVGEFLVQIDASVYVIDCLPNMGAADVRAKCIPLVKQLRAARPEIPIVLVEDRRNTNSWVLAKRNQYHTDNHAALRECFATLQQEGVKGLFYLGGDDLLGHDDEGATDGSHPNDLGFILGKDGERIPQSLKPPGHLINCRERTVSQ